MFHSGPSHFLDQKSNFLDFIFDTNRRVISPRGFNSKAERSLPNWRGSNPRRSAQNDFVLCFPIYTILSVLMACVITATPPGSMQKQLSKRLLVSNVLRHCDICTIFFLFCCLVNEELRLHCLSENGTELATLLVDFCGCYKRFFASYLTEW